MLLWINTEEYEALSVRFSNDHAAVTTETLTQLVAEFLRDLNWQDCESERRDNHDGTGVHTYRQLDLSVEDYRFVTERRQRIAKRRKREGKK